MQIPKGQSRIEKFKNSLGFVGEGSIFKQVANISIKREKVDFFILTAASVKSFGRLTLTMLPKRDLPSKESAADASSGVRNSTKACPFSL